MVRCLAAAHTAPTPPGLFCYPAVRQQNKPALMESDENSDRNPT